MIPILRILTVASACVIGATAAQADTFRLSHSYEPSKAHGKRADWIARAHLTNVESFLTDV